MQLFLTFLGARVSGRRQSLTRHKTAQRIGVLILFVVQGHAGNFVFGLIGAQKTPVALLVGRAQSVSC